MSGLGQTLLLTTTFFATLNARALAKEDGGGHRLTHKSLHKLRYRLQLKVLCQTLEGPVSGVRAFLSNIPCHFVSYQEPLCSRFPWTWSIDGTPKKLIQGDVIFMFHHTCHRLICFLHRFTFLDCRYPNLSVRISRKETFPRFLR